MRLLRVAWLLLAAALIQACLVVSLHPVYSAETIAFDAALVGNWVGDEESATVTFERAEWLSYHLVFTDGGKTTRLSGRLTRVGDLQLLDVSPLDGADIPDLQIPVHAIYKIAIDGDTLSTAALSYDRFYAMAKAGNTDAGLVLDARKNAVLTASTPDLRQWLQAHGTDDGLFDAPAIFRRKVGEPVP